jgi:hypothetical protein
MSSVRDLTGKLNDLKLTDGSHDAGLTNAMYHLAIRNNIKPINNNGLAIAMSRLAVEKRSPQNAKPQQNITNAMSRLAVEKRLPQNAKPQQNPAGHINIRLANAMRDRAQTQTQVRAQRPQSDILADELALDLSRVAIGTKRTSRKRDNSPAKLLRNSASSARTVIARQPKTKAFTSIMFMLPGKVSTRVLASRQEKFPLDSLTLHHFASYYTQDYVDTLKQDTWQQFTMPDTTIVAVLDTGKEKRYMFKGNTFNGARELPKNISQIKSLSIGGDTVYVRDKTRKFALGYVLKLLSFVNAFWIYDSLPDKNPDEVRLMCKVFFDYTTSKEFTKYAKRYASGMHSGTVQASVRTTGLRNRSQR